MTFGGYLDQHPQGLVARVLARSYAGDWRDPEQVAEWVHHICRQYTVVDAVPRQRVAPASRPPRAPSPAATRP